jgi:predicted XRE-type DNA-binding protein
MNPATRAKLEPAGFKIGTADEFLGLTEAEAKLVTIRLALAGILKERRRQAGLSQVALARQLKSSQSRVAKMEAADPTVSVDLLLKALFTAGARPRVLAAAFARIK